MLLFLTYNNMDSCSYWALDQDVAFPGKMSDWQSTLMDCQYGRQFVQLRMLSKKRISIQHTIQYELLLWLLLVPCRANLPTLFSVLGRWKSRPWRILTAGLWVSKLLWHQTTAIALHCAVQKKSKSILQVRFGGAHYKVLDLIPELPCRSPYNF